MRNCSAMICYLFVAVLPPLTSKSQDTEAVDMANNPGSISRVTLYRDQALVTRVISIPPAAKEQEILVGRLPEQVLKQSVHGEGGEGVEILSVRVTPQLGSTSDRQDVNALEKQRRELLEKADTNTRNLQLAEKKIRYIDQLMNFSSATAHADISRGVLNSSSLIDIVNYSLDQQTDLQQELLDLQTQQRELTLQAETLEAQLALLSAPSGNQHEAKLVVLNRNAGDGRVELSYLVTNCGWAPQYTIHGNVGEGIFSLRYGALVEQMSGERWKDVQLTLSTASPSISAAGPSLTPFRIQVSASFQQSDYGNDALNAQTQSLRQQQLAVESEFAAMHSYLDNMTRDHALNAVANSLQNMELQADPKQLKTLASDATDDVASQSYIVGQAVTLESRREQQLVQILDAQLAGELYHVATPLLSSFAYREADIVNDRKEGFLRGPAMIYLDDRFVGQMEIPSIASGQHLIVGFGADQQVRTRRELLDKGDEVQGGNRRLTFKYRLVVANFKGEPVAIRVFDRMPLASQAAQISVQSLEFAHSLSNDGLYARMLKPRGVLRWDLDIPAERFGEQAFDIDYSYIVEFDRNQSLVGLDNPRQLEADYLELGAPSGMGGMGGGMGGGLFKP